jgi:hypothetical protein
MGGGLMQLVAYGAQDIYLTSNPQITFFKVVYRRHTNFSRETIEQTFSGTAGADKTINVTISRNGDLVHRLYLECDQNSTSVANTPHNVGHAIIDYVELEIGGQTIDKLYGHWMEVWARLTEPNETGSVGVMNASGASTISRRVPGMTTGGTVASGLAADVNYLTKFQKLACAGGVSWDSPSASWTAANNEPTIGSPALQVPLPFWFCKNPGLALPLIALQYHEVKLKLKFTSTNKGGANVSTMNPKVWAEYIYLDTAERRRFAQVSHEYLIEQVQKFESSTDSAVAGVISSKTLDLNFNHPVKELIFASDYDTTNASSARYGSLPGWADKDTAVTLKLNGHDRFSADRRWDYFSKTQIWEHHTGPGNLEGGHEGFLTGSTDGLVLWGTSTSAGAAAVRGFADQIGVYSFALKPEEHQPSGTCNFSRIDSTRLTFKNCRSKATNSINIIVYAVNYNVLRIMSGMGGLAYSN